VIKLLAKLPRNIHLAVSGGIDSVVALDFLARNHNITIVHMNHKEGNSDASADFVLELAIKYGCKLVYDEIKQVKPRNLSREEFWRNERYKLFHRVAEPVITAHTLDDCVETWLWSSLNGIPKIIPYNNINVIRPFLATKKSDFNRWANRNNLKWVEDESNSDLSLTRNFIRKELMPKAMQVNPGLYKTIFKKVMNNG